MLHCPGLPRQRVASERGQGANSQHGEGDAPLVGALGAAASGHVDELSARYDQALVRRIVETNGDAKTANLLKSPLKVAK